MLQLLRHLHPERSVVGEDKMLDPSNRKWRRKAALDEKYRFSKTETLLKLYGNLELKFPV